MVRWHHQHNELEQTLGDSEGQGILVYCSPWRCKESDMTEQQQRRGRFTNKTQNKIHSGIGSGRLAPTWLCQ